MLGLFYYVLNKVFINVFINVKGEVVNITDEKFVEVLKSLTQEDFDAVQNIVEQLTAKFDNNETKGMLTENEIQNVSNLIKSNSQEVSIGVLVTKFQYGGDV